MKRYKAAVSDRNNQSEGHRGFTTSLPESVAAEWEDMCVKWDADSFPKTEANPYAVQGAGKRLRSCPCSAVAHLFLRCDRCGGRCNVRRAGEGGKGV